MRVSAQATESSLFTASCREHLTPVSRLLACSFDRDYETLRIGMQNLFHDLGITAAAV